MEINTYSNIKVFTEQTFSISNCYSRKKWFWMWQPAQLCPNTIKQNYIHQDLCIFLTTKWNILGLFHTKVFVGILSLSTRNSSITSLCGNPGDISDFFHTCHSAELGLLCMLSEQQKMHVTTKVVWEQHICKLHKVVYYVNNEFMYE